MPDTAHALLKFLHFVIGEFRRHHFHAIFRICRSAIVIKTYLYLEQLRFGDELHVELDIAETDFYLPALTFSRLSKTP